MKRRVIPHKERIGPENISNLDLMDFVFICVDSNDARNLIAKYLADHEKPFVDSGLGLDIVNGRIVGQVRVTTAFPVHYDHLRDAFGVLGKDNDPYASNIQIGVSPMSEPTQPKLASNKILWLFAVGQRVTPLDPDEWQLSFDGETVSLYPSIGNYRFPCHSHYFITKNKVRWVIDDGCDEPSSMRKRKRASFWKKLFGQ